LTGNSDDCSHPECGKVLHTSLTTLELYKLENLGATEPLHESNLILFPCKSYCFRANQSRWQDVFCADLLRLLHLAVSVSLILFPCKSYCFRANQSCWQDVFCADLLRLLHLASVCRCHLFVLTFKRAAASWLVYVVLIFPNAYIQTNSLGAAPMWQAYMLLPEV